MITGLVKNYEDILRTIGLRDNITIGMNYYRLSDSTGDMSVIDL